MKAASDKHDEPCSKRAKNAPSTRLSPWLTSKYAEYVESSEVPGLGYISVHASTRPGPVSLEGYGKHVFRGAVAAPFLASAGLPKDALEDPSWTTNGSADKVAAAMLAWARTNGASYYCHWFHPLGAAGLRHGQSAQVKSDCSNSTEFPGDQCTLGPERPHAIRC